MPNQQKMSNFRVLGGILLVAGCSIGAAMLGLPVLSAPAGFIPSSVFYFLSWLFMMTTGLLVLEVNLWFDKEVSFVTMVGSSLGRAGQALAWFLFIFLFYSLMIAFVLGSGSLFSGFVEDFGGYLEPWKGSFIFIVIFGVLVYLGTRAVDIFNRFLMIGLIASYLFLVFIGMDKVNISYLKHHNWSAAWFVIPAMIISFGYHNLIPSLTTYLDRDPSKLKKIIIFGSFLPLCMYLLWQFLILGIVSQTQFAEALDVGQMATQALKKATDSSSIILFAELFAFFSLVSTFLSVALSFVDFLADGFSIEKTPKGKMLLCTMVLFPPFLFSFISPTIFLRALSVAGGYGAVVLFGVLPALAVWVGRYRQKRREREILGGGKIMLALVIAFALMVVGIEIIQDVL